MILVVVLAVLASTTASGQCAATKTEYDLLSISEMEILQIEKDEVAASDNYIDIFFLTASMAAEPTGYRLVVNVDGSYKLSRGTKSHAFIEVNSGLFKAADVEKLKALVVCGDTNLLFQCRGVAAEGTAYLLIKKMGIVKIFSLDGELERTFRENGMNDLAICFRIFYSLINH